LVSTSGVVPRADVPVSGEVQLMGATIICGRRRPSLVSLNEFEKRKKCMAQTDRHITSKPIQTMGE